MTLTCDICGAETAFDLDPADIGSARIYCSLDCRAAADGGEDE